MNKDLIKKRIETEDDYIYSPKFDNSLSKLIDSYPDGIEDDKIAKVLLIETDEVEKLFQSAIKKIKKNLNIE